MFIFMFIYTHKWGYLIDLSSRACEAQNTAAAIGFDHGSVDLGDGLQ